MYLSVFCRARMLALFLLPLAVASTAAANSFFFSTGNPDGKFATLSHPASAGPLGTETADDLVLDRTTIIKSATFTGLPCTAFGLRRRYGK